MNAIARQTRASSPIPIRGGLLDLTRRELIAPDQTRTAFGRVEGILLGRLVRSPSEYVSSDELLGLLWPADSSKSHNSVQSVVARARRVLRRLPEGDKLVQTGYGRGYRFVPPRGTVCPAPERPVRNPAPLVELLRSEPTTGLVALDPADARRVVASAVQELDDAMRVTLVDLSDVTTSCLAVRRIAEAVGADLRGLSLRRNQLQLVCRILEREQNLLLVLLHASPQMGATLSSLRRLADRGRGLQLLVTARQPIPELMPQLLDLRGQEARPATLEGESAAATALVRCLRALDTGEYGRALSFISNPAPTCEAPGLKVELLLARARAERALGLSRSALKHALQAVAAANQTSLTPLKRRAVGMRDALTAELPEAPLIPVISAPPRINVA